ncbi:hypothetical protein MASR2M18_13590 [Ignavibacteria bacterium]|nr:NADH-quinone oxidoreductase subunit C [Bacteroidota bacterium]MCZ2132525.1 NADH-quinone oxidoreductase subunit C [Bacteroidota bacterium]
MRSFSETMLDIARSITPEAELVEHRNQYTVIVPQSALLETCLELRDNPQSDFKLLIDITAIDHNKRGARFEVVYILASISYKTRLRIKTPVQEKNPRCPSVVNVWECADWYEREAYDMYGIHFNGHPDLRRFYMPEDFADPQTGEPLYPLRKDFPLMGVPGSLPLPPLPTRI